ncbi:16S rRNA (adenine(1518)-N(6)/adenine(1519)-N(6))-dimethyltransferaseRsmA [soil metagenome]
MAKFAPYTLKKSLGQHFLKDDSICLKIVSALMEKPFTQLVEVGPGGGALTKHLVAIPDIKFFAVELDDEKVAYLYNHYPTLQNKIIHKDFLEIEPPFEGKFTLIGNFPYNISSEILFKAIDWKDQVECLIGMFQKEVAMRVAAPPGSKVYGVTSALIQAYFTVEYLFDVPPSSFNPPPKVMSGVIRMMPKVPRPAEAGTDTNPSAGFENTIPQMRSNRHYKILVKTAFNQRRKQLRNAVKPLFDEATLRDGIFTKRAEQLSIHDFAMLTFKMK